MDILSLLCFFCVLPIFILLFFGLVIGILYRDRRKHAEAWRELAQRARLTFHEPSWFLARPALSGTWHGRAVRAYTRSRGSTRTGGGVYMYVEMAVNLPEGTRFELTERNILNWPRPQDIASGEAEFDQRFIARGHPPEMIRQLLSNGGLRRLMLQSRTLNLETAPGCLRYRQLNVETDADTMLFLLSLLFDMMETIERENPGFFEKPGF